jgi:ribosome-binding factor A
MKQPSQRQLRVAEQIRGIISETLHQGHFTQEILVERAREITVGGVDVSPDLKNGKVFVMSLHENDLNEILPALNDNAHYFQKEINRKLNIKFTPKLRFFKDETFAEAQRIETLLSSIK